MLIRYKFEDNFQNAKFITQLEHNLTCLDYLFFYQEVKCWNPHPSVVEIKKNLNDHSL